MELKTNDQIYVTIGFYWFSCEVHKIQNLQFAETCPETNGMNQNQNWMSEFTTIFMELKLYTIVLFSGHELDDVWLVWIMSMSSSDILRELH